VVAVKSILFEEYNMNKDIFFVTAVVNLIFAGLPTSGYAGGPKTGNQESEGESKQENA
jgi:hypothetical protein